MRLYFNYCPLGFSNCYILGTQEPEPLEAIIIDPGNMDANILGRIEDNNYKLRGILLTHDHSDHAMGIRTILKIYDTEIFAINPVVRECRTTKVRDGETFTLGTFKVEVISIPGHSADSAVFRIGRLLFTGDALSAGFMGTTISSYGAAAQVNSLRSKIFSLPGDYTILPGHGPPTTLEAERRFNLDLNTFEERQNRRQTFKVDL
ncbi:MAG: MBL fold metallo-hydrolase [Treponema sp.]|nr:MBL fold metallo-hydrolase [Treponema sp.]